MKINQVIEKHERYPSKILQFGEGNFLRAFVDWMIDKQNKSKDLNMGITIVQPLEHGLVEILNNQNNLYTVIENGVKEGLVVDKKTVVESINHGINPYSDFEMFLATARDSQYQFVISNTTEAGIAYVNTDNYGDTPQSSFPGKVTRWLHERFLAFEGNTEKGVVFIPCELIDKNGDALKKAILQYAELWNLEPDFVAWIEQSNTFCNSLVDRIVSGYPRHREEELIEILGYEDDLMVETEPFYLWVIEGDEEVQKMLPLDEELNVIFTKDLTPYRTRKVRLLNGPHTCMVPVGLLLGIDTVKEALDDEVVGTFIHQLMFEEIIDTLTLDKEELMNFAKEVLDRFKNPFVIHQLMSISLNSNSKYRTRVLPSLKDYLNKNHKLPKRMVFALASMIYLFKGEINGKYVELKDDPDVLDMYMQLWNQHEEGDIELKDLVHHIFSNEKLWFEDLNQIDGLFDLTLEYLEKIQLNGMLKAIKVIM